MTPTSDPCVRFACGDSLELNGIESSRNISCAHALGDESTHLPAHSSRLQATAAQNNLKAQRHILDAGAASRVESAPLSPPPDVVTLTLLG